jgi:hypothetical protein
MANRRRWLHLVGLVLLLAVLVALGVDLSVAAIVRLWRH